MEKDHESDSLNPQVKLCVKKNSRFVMAVRSLELQTVFIV